MTNTKTNEDFIDNEYKVIKTNCFTKYHFPEGWETVDLTLDYHEETNTYMVWCDDGSKGHKFDNLEDAKRCMDIERQRMFNRGWELC